MTYHIMDRSRSEKFVQQDNSSLWAFHYDGATHDVKHFGSEGSALIGVTRSLTTLSLLGSDSVDSLWFRRRVLRSHIA